MLKTLRNIAVALVGVLTPSFLGAQMTDAAPMLKVGDMAPDFTLGASTRAGVATAPVKLSALKGKTVVLAFFPRARTSGCTIQMTHYRDEYDKIFGAGKSATLFAISSDSSKATAAWAADSAFQFTFLADVELTAGKLYGAAPARGTSEQRILYVVGPDGKIAHIMRPFREIDPTSYTELTAAIAAANKGAKQ